MSSELEKQIEAKFRKNLLAKSCLVYKFVSPGNAGVPDRIVILPSGKVIFVELKRKGKQLRKLQEFQARKLARCNCKVYVIDSIQKIEEFMEEVMPNESTIQA